MSETGYAGVSPVTGICIRGVEGDSPVRCDACGSNSWGYFFTKQTGCAVCDGCGKTMSCLAFARRESNARATAPR